MNEPRPERPLLTPVADLLGEALRLYARHAPVLIVTAFVGAWVGSLVGLIVSPSTLPMEILWALFISALTTGLQAPVWLQAAFARSNRPVNVGAIFYGVPALSPRFFGVGLVLGAWSGGLLMFAVSLPALSLPVLCVLVYAAVRFSLAGPVIIFENYSPLYAITRSWMLVRGNWWRTFIVQLPVMVFALTLVIIGAQVAERAGAAIAGGVVGAIALGASAPLVALVETALYEEYRGVTRGTLPKESEE